MSREGVMAGLTERIGKVKAWGRGKVDDWRVRRLSFDHLIRAVQRYQVQFGDRLAGAVTYFAFLSFFPLMALSYAVLGLVVATSETTREALEAAIVERLPGIAGQLDLDAISTAKATAGIIGLLGLLYAGLGAMDALRGALREMSMTTEPPLNFFLGKLRDLASIAMIGVTMISSVLVAGFATTATDNVLEFLFGSESALATTGLRLAGVAASVGADWLLFLILLGWVARLTQPFRVIARGALLGAMGFGVLKQLATLLLGQTLGNPVYGTFAVIVGLLVWINFSARLVLYVAAWTATAGLCPPPSPTPPPTSEA
ncbi:YihY/virulence factor BrkB family protein [Nonomuraea turcica]|uniref:YihY/virulence factor BrkB family protein n=1 Tax=Nonomuraea sp. G32 TaxID=3067274 RepID=UPI00273B2C60|nr:YihY/virulence factor BrkB family protein [Nonomuraea sp. G32]MDP4506544.1 YihY/virulence factor BrkB family protein [Nonomuraea sp. G32]